MQETKDNKTHGDLFPTERVHIYAVLQASGFPMVRCEVTAQNRLVFYFARFAEDGRSVHDVLRDYANRSLSVDAKTFVDHWMEGRDMTRNKEFAGGTTKTVHGA